MTRKDRKHATGGFTLIEAVVATTLLGIGIAALMTTVGAQTRVNSEGKLTTQAIFLTQEIREWTLRLPFDDPTSPPGYEGTDPQTYVNDLDDLMDAAFNPPRNALGQPLTDMSEWSQTITISWRNPNNLTESATTGSTDVIHVEVNIKHNGTSVLTTGWIVVKKE